MTNRDAINEMFANKSNKEVANYLIGGFLSCGKCLASDYCAKVISSPLLRECRPFCERVIVEWLEQEFTIEN